MSRGYNYFIHLHKENSKHHNSILPHIESMLGGRISIVRFCIIVHVFVSKVSGGCGKAGVFITTVGMISQRDYYVELESSKIFSNAVLADIL